ncbi:MAG TPA: hypothetical protein VHV10_15180 [Ktedonobacteraceae bacterium]|nr:hypothetical protein [Ktedonobacteraceae bacterium]
MANGNEDHMLTTVDNPWSPFTNYDEWYAYDHAKGYDTPGYLARIANISFDLSDADLDDSIEQAIETIVTENVSGMYRKASRPQAA